MAFVAFGKKKGSTQQQQQPGGSQIIFKQIEEASELAKSPQQQQVEGQSSASNGRGALNMTSENAAVDDEGLFTMSGDVGGSEYFPEGVLCESPTFPPTTQQAGILDPEVVRSIPQIMEHNTALRKNFDTLKELHLQLSESHAQLREAYASLQNDQKMREAKELTLLKNNEITTLAHEMEQRNLILEKKITSVQEENRDLILKLESVRKEKEQVLVAKHIVELEYTKELSLAKVDDNAFRQQAADLAHKCKHLEKDLEKSVTAGDALQQQLVSVAFEKDSKITDLEQALRRVREDLQSTERRYRAYESEWETERQKLISKLEDKERQEHTMKSNMKEEAELKLKDALKEVSELRAMLITLEKPRADAELLHVETVRELTKELDTLRQELGKALAAEKIASGRVMEMEHMKVQLETSSTQTKNYLDRISCLMKAKEELENNSETLKCQLVELGTIRNVECNDHAKQLESLQRRCAREKSAAMQKAERTTKQIQKILNSKIDSLKTRLKQTQKSLGATTVDRNQLLIRVRESEAQLAIFQTQKVQFYTPCSKFTFPVDRFVDSTITADLKPSAPQHHAKSFAVPQRML